MGSKKEEERGGGRGRTRRGRTRRGRTRRGRRRRGGGRSKRGID
jgi:hypothetical protein